MSIPSIHHPTDRPNFYSISGLTTHSGESVQVVYSYKTPIAYQVGYSKIVTRRNDWGPTTGKHLNWCDDDKANRIDGQVFVECLERLLSKTSRPRGLPKL